MIPLNNKLRLYSTAQIIFNSLVWSRILGTLRPDEGDGNKNVKNTTLHAQHTVWPISGPSRQEYNGPNFSFYGGRKQATTKFSSELG